MGDHSFYESLAQWSEIVGGLAFIVVSILLFRKFVLPAVAQATVARNAELLDAEKHRDELRVKVEEARTRLADADRQAVSIGARSVSDAERERDRIIAEARAEGTRLLRNAEGELERGRIAARDRLRMELIEKALLRARELATTGIDDAANARLVEKTVDAVVAERTR
jgi:F-type H+-transporting ATPase subunit b